MNKNMSKNIFLSVVIILLGAFLATNAFASGLSANTLVKSDTSPAVYEVDQNGQLWLFASESVFYSWYDSFDGLTTVSDQTLADYEVAGNKVYNSDSILIKSADAPEVYSINEEGQLRYVPNWRTAFKFYGQYWEQMIQVVTEEELADYPIGPDHVNIGSKCYDDEPYCSQVQLYKTIYGRVTDAETGEPVYGKTVCIGYSNVYDVTDRNGEFVINMSHLSDGEKTVYAAGGLIYNQSEEVTASAGDEILFEISAK